MKTKQAQEASGCPSEAQLLGDKHPRTSPTPPDKRTLTQARLLNMGCVWVSMQLPHPVGTQRVGFLVRRVAAINFPAAGPHVALMVSAPQACSGLTPARSLSVAALAGALLQQATAHISGHLLPWA